MILETRQPEESECLREWPLREFSVARNTGEIAARLDIRRVRAPPQRQRHLLRRCPQPVPNHLEGDRIEAGKSKHGGDLLAAQADGCEWRKYSDGRGAGQLSEVDP